MNLPYDMINSILHQSNCHVIKSYLCTHHFTNKHLDTLFWTQKIKAEHLHYIPNLNCTKQEYYKLYQSKYEIDKAFDIMEIEYQQSKNKQKNGKLNIDFKRCKNFHKVLEILFGKALLIDIRAEAHIEIILDENPRVMLNIDDYTDYEQYCMIDRRISMNEIKKNVLYCFLLLSIYRYTWFILWQYCNTIISITS